MEQVKVADVAVIGAGPAGLMAAEEIARAGHAVTVYERMPAPARKFLLAGRGGLNLTHGEAVEKFLSRYGEGTNRLRSFIERFPPAALRAWSHALGEKTFEGSSGRIFPESFKASPLLRAWLRRLNESGVTFAFRHRWRGWNEAGALAFDAPRGRVDVSAHATVLALGGASWPRLGSDGAWAEILAGAGVALSPLQASNCGFLADWSASFRTRFAGTPLKRIALSFEDVTVRGEAVIAEHGIEGGAVYALSSRLREAILREDAVELLVDLRPDYSRGQIAQKLGAPRGKQSFSNFLRKALHLPPVAIALLQEGAARSGLKLAEMRADDLAAVIKAAPLRLTGVAPIETAISTAGGISFDELDGYLMLKKHPGTFAAGEMLDWEAPTGGYLLQASFATGVAAGQGVLRYLSENDCAHNSARSGSDTA